MRQFGLALALILLTADSALAQDKLVGRWEGKLQSPQGERDTTLVIKKDGGVYTGTMPGMAGRMVDLKDFKVEGDLVTARADVETPQATITINYRFTLAGETMKGQGALDFGGQAVTFDLNLKRTSADPGPATAAPAAGGGGARQRLDVPQPQQKQSLEYFVGAWKYKYVGRESELGPAPRECTITFAKRADGQSAEGAANCTADGGAFRNTTLLVWDEAAKSLRITETLANGVTIASKGDWSSPISIRFAVEPVKARGQSLQLRRTITIVAAHSFTVTEDLSEDGGPFVRLGSAVYSRTN
jgi:hypothetical protein